MLNFFDFHTHLQFPEYDSDRDEVFARAFDKKVGMVNVGTKKETSIKAVELAELYPDKFIYASVGAHPIEFSEFFDYAFYKSLAGNKNVVAIGECGLDYYRIAGSLKKENGSSENIRFLDEKKEQKKLFLQQIELAKETGLPLMIHCRPSPNSMDAYEDVFEILLKDQAGLAGGIMHFFAGNKELAEKFLNLGFYFTFGGAITFTRDYDEIIKNLPINKLLLETDAPFLAPVPCRGKRNEPAYIIETYKKMAEIKKTDFEVLRKQIIKNSEEALSISLS